MPAYLATLTARIRLGERLSSAAKLHPVVAYVLLTYCISWGICLLAPALAAGDLDVQRQIAMLAVFGPALAATAVTACCGPAPAPASRATQAIAFTAALLTGCLAWYLMYRSLPESQMQPGLWWLDVLSAAIAAYVVASRTPPLRGTHGLRARLTDWRSGLRWYLLAVLFWPLLVVFEGVLSRLLGIGPYAASPLLTDARAWPRYLVLVALALFYGGGLEELGWRGFALPRLQQRYSPLVATVIVGLMWAVWHGPIYYGVSADAIVGILPMALWTTAGGCLFTWVYNGSGGNLIALVLLHTMANTVGDPFLPSGPMPRALAALLGILLVFAGRMWRRLEAAPDRSR